MARKPVDPRLAKAYPETDQLSRNVRMLMEQNRTSPDELMQHLGLCRNTFYKRLKFPREFTAGNLEDMAKLWGVSVSQLCGKPVMTADAPLTYDGEVLA